MPEKVEVDTVVSIHYSLSLDSGQKVDSSSGGEPLDYLHGHGNIVPGLEVELTGRTIGESVKTRVAPENGYGERDPARIQTVPRSVFPDDLEMAEGMRLNAQDDKGVPIQMQVTAIQEDEVTVDLNHPLAGEGLNFEVEVVQVRAATQEELAHGHVHGPGDSH